MPTAKNANTKQRPGRPAKYPWERWFKSKELTLVRGVDFYCQCYSMMLMLRKEAKRRSKLVSINIIENQIKLFPKKG